MLACRSTTPLSSGDPAADSGREAATVSRLDLAVLAVDGENHWRTPSAPPEEGIGQVGVGQPARPAEAVQLVADVRGAARARCGDPIPGPRLAPEHAQALEPELGEVDHVAEDLGVPQHLVLGPQPSLDEAGQPGRASRVRRFAPEVVGVRALDEEPRGLGPRTRRGALLPGRPFEQPDDLRASAVSMSAWKTASTRPSPTAISDATCSA
jgi:hypothetical protein